MRPISKFGVVAGGAGALGKTFVKALLKANHQVYVLSRSARKSDNPNLAYIKVSYDNVANILAVLEDHQIDTVISALSMLDDAASQSQLNLIAAADKSSTTKRFIPSEFGVVANAVTEAIDPYVQYWLASAAALERTHLQYTRISCGFLMDYWGMPNVDTELAEYAWGVDIARRVAAIPGTGDERLTLTYTRDLAAFVVRLLDEQEWPTKAAVVGQDVTFNQILRWAEEARGGEAFKVVYDDEEKLARGEVTPFNGAGGASELPQWLAARFGLLMVKQLILMPDEKGFRLNERFPELKVTTAEELIRKSWARK